MTRQWLEQHCTRGALSIRGDCKLVYLYKVKQNQLSLVLMRPTLLSTTVTSRRVLTETNGACLKNSQSDTGLPYAWIASSLIDRPNGWQIV